MTDSNTPTMPRAKIAIAIDERILEAIDRLVRDGVYPNRSRAIQRALEEKLDRLKRGRLARECAKLDPYLEKSSAEEGIAEDLERWAEY